MPKSAANVAASLASTSPLSFSVSPSAVSSSSSSSSPASPSPRLLAPFTILLALTQIFAPASAVSLRSQHVEREFESSQQDLASAKVLSIDESPCASSGSVGEEECLAKNNKECMWLQLESQNLCRPCSWDGNDVPCATTGSVLPEGKVVRCEMGCAHRKALTSMSSCTDLSGSISRSDCRAKGISADTKCMWTSFRAKDGSTKSSCGPCYARGVGHLPKFLAGAAGPEEGSTVLDSYSQCEEKEPPLVEPCAPTPKPLVPGGLPESVPLESLGLHRAEGAPHYIAVPVPYPWTEEALKNATRSAAKLAGWPEGTKLPPDVVLGLPKDAPPQGPHLPRYTPTVASTHLPGLTGDAVEAAAIVESNETSTNETSASATPSPTSWPSEEISTSEPPASLLATSRNTSDVRGTKPGFDQQQGALRASRPRPGREEHSSA